MTPPMASDSLSAVLGRWRRADAKVADAILAGDADVTHLIGKWLPVGSGVALLASLFVHWYSLKITSAGAPNGIDLASTALQWMATESWIIASVALIVAAVSGWRAWAGSIAAELLGDRGVIRIELFLAAVAAVIIIYRLIVPPSLPGSSAQYHLTGQTSLGPCLALLIVVLMLLGLWIQRAELMIASKSA